MFRDFMDKLRRIFGRRRDQDDDYLSWSWDELTGGVRDELTDDEAAAVALFAGIPEDEIEQTKRQYEELFNGI